MKEENLQQGSKTISLSCSYVIETIAQKHERESTRIKKKLFLEILENTRGMISATCEKTGISRATYYVWINNDVDFKKSIDEIIGSKAFILEDKMYLNAMNGDFKSQKYLLDRIHPGFKKQSRDKKESTVHIYHHVSPKKEEVHEKTIEDMIAEGVWVDDNLYHPNNDDNESV